MTKVIYRKFPDGEVIALFPELVGDSDYGSIMSYMHVGQHGAACTGLIAHTKAASPKEYEALHDELVAIGYDDLKVYKRITENMREQNRIEWNRFAEFRG